MNKQVVSIETLKSYFETGKKPTQAQFANLIDAFYHKNEGIPQDKIDGLADTLSNKAETTAVDAKANADASGLGDENVAKWKEVLGVGEIPKNMAKIDTESEQGNAYTKEQVDDLLENINTENISNADLNLEPGTVRTFDITGAKFQMKGLQNKDSDASFNKKLIVNDNGEFAVKEDGDVIINVPNQLEITGNVNVIYPNTIPSNQLYMDGLQEVFRQYRTLKLTPITKNDLEIKTFENQKIENNKVYDDNRFALNVEGIKDYPVGADLAEMTTANIELPADKDWIFKVYFQNVSDVYNGGNFFCGVARDKEAPVSFGIQTAGYGGIKFVERLSQNQCDFMRNNLTLLIIKLGNTITTIADKKREPEKYKKTFWVSNAEVEFGNYIPKIILKAGNAKVVGKMFYKILD